MRQAKLDPVNLDTNLVEEILKGERKKGKKIHESEFEGKKFTPRARTFLYKGTPTLHVDW